MGSWDQTNEGAVDLMIHYVECGNNFTLDYGDINEAFYDALIEMYEKAVKAVCKLPMKKKEFFRKRLEKIMKSADGIGWGYYDDLCHFYYEAFEQIIDTQNKRIHSDVSSAGGPIPPVIRSVRS